MARILRVGLLLVTVFSHAVSPQASLAADFPGDPQAQRPRFHAQQQAVPDLRLSRRGSLDGLVVERQGTPSVGEKVVLFRNGERHAEVLTNRDGQFSFSGLNGGVYEVSCTGFRGVYRVWAAATAPPSSRDGLLILDKASLVRGQHDLSPWFTKQSIISAAIVGGAVLVPVIVINQRRSSS